MLLLFVSIYSYVVKHMNMGKKSVCNIWCYSLNYVHIYVYMNIYIYISHIYVWEVALHVLLKFGRRCWLYLEVTLCLWTLQQKGGLWEELHITRNTAWIIMYILTKSYWAATIVDTYSHCWFVSSSEQLIFLSLWEGGPLQLLEFILSVD